MKRIVRSIVALACVTLVGCAGPSDPVIDKALELLEGAYVLKLKPADASFAKCKYMEFEGRHIAQCGFAFGSSSLEKVGFWELNNQDGNPEAYAMNGNALRDLEQIGSFREFKSGAGQRTPLDIVKVRSAWE